MLIVGVAGLSIGAALFAAGFLVSSLSGDSDEKGVEVQSTHTPTKTATVLTARPTRTPTAGASPTPETAMPAAPAQPVILPTRVPASPTPTPDFTKQPAIQILNTAPPIGTHIKTASVDIAIEVSYQAGRDSNVLAWELYYCAGPSDCNTYGSRNEKAVVPGAAGTTTIGGPFPAGGNYLRPIVVCRYTVVIGHYLTPEDQWQTEMSPDERCQGGADYASVRVTGVSPDIGAQVGEGEIVTAYVEYGAYGASQLQVIARGDGCVVIGSRTIDLARDSSSVATVHITSSPPGIGTLREVEAALLDEGVVKARYDFGGC